MKRILIMCEGPNEKKIIDILLTNGCLRFSQDDLLGLTSFHARQISTSGQVKAELNIFPGTVDVYRIGDTQSDKLVIPKDYRDKIEEIHKYCTKPELEMLLIIAAGLEKEYEVGLLVDSIKRYKALKGKGHSKGELCLAELLK